MKTKNHFKIGDQVSVISDTMTGNIVHIDQDTIKIECLDGFLYTFNAIELVLRKEWNPMIKHDIKDHKGESVSGKKERFRSKKGNSFKEVDLHIHELIDSEKGMSSYDKLSFQLKAAQNELETAIRKKHLIQFLTKKQKKRKHLTCLPFIFQIMATALKKLQNSKPYYSKM